MATLVSHHDQSVSVADFKIKFGVVAAETLQPVAPHISKDFVTLIELTQIITYKTGPKWS